MTTQSQPNWHTVEPNTVQPMPTSFGSSTHLQKLLTPSPTTAETTKSTTNQSYSRLSQENVNKWNAQNTTAQNDSQRLYSTRTATETTVDDKDFARNSRRQSQRHKEKMDRARREFISAPPTQAGSDDLNRTAEEFFQKSIEDIRRPYEPGRGPLLEKFHDREWHSKVCLEL